MKRALLLLAMITTAIPAAAQEYDQSAAFGMARIISLAGRCGYSIDQDAMIAYLRKAGLDNPGAFGFISIKVSVDSGTAEKASDAECTIVKGTAQSFGIIKK
jgi:AICAR transformylase/IMP cyclohydrolase PurH